MQQIKLLIHDEVNCSFVGLSPEIRRHLYKASEVFSTANRFIPSVRMGRWSGKESYFGMGGNTYINLIEPMIDYISEHDCEIEIEDERTYNRHFEFDTIDNNFLSNHVWPKSHAMAGQPIELRDHQTEAVNMFLSNIQGIACLPTASGKSLITAILSKKVEKYGRSIVIVPNKDLITQTEQYYVDLGYDVGVYYGDRKDFFKTHTICTWQSLEKLRQNPIDIGLEIPITFDMFMTNVVAVIIDECHGVKAKTLSGLLTKELSHIPVRWALSGTIPKEPHEIINLNISIGDVIHTLHTEELQEKGILSNCDVHIIQMVDTKEFPNYASEYDYLVTDKDRLKFISTLIEETSKTGNVLVLVGRKETGKEMEKLIPNSIFLSGATKTDIRKEHYNEVKTSNSKVIIATVGIAAVGIDVPRLNHLFIVESGKSFVRTVQSIGRVLRTAFDKNHANIWDICSTCRYSKKHLTDRKRWYREQKFPFKIEKVMWQ